MNDNNKNSETQETQIKPNWNFKHLGVIFIVLILALVAISYMDYVADSVSSSEQSNLLNKIY